ncbi:Txe/YoeB family addiction module toxin [Enterococcus faecium]|uniref:Txe/YoeB family addiction module toxin n=1 Tax=Enterococcus TaxID=1350 RepID=UPI00046E4B6C|nr:MULTISPECIES: Txe/YoeB family addiction module toxin [Enterococcus]EGP4721918.1 Txe/YoeB family addiction module toxin [Enterococcus faecium]EGP5446228.1 Txe/YoeB family addiction module toxin [Enterococcus faecium]EIY5795995.1 Txe/YoeB family addiction module toxin [Enterococcus faecium]MBM3077294.1 Txe/YoeB family addiction module toxin [Enterococcus lactis]MDQ8299166.1 Txe/YoeB family addiction module toxin [Enterococcus faecium]
MNNYSVMIKNSAKADLKEIKQSNLKPQFEKVIQTLKEDPYLPTQSFEKLKPTHEGRYSRRLNRQHRVVYKVDEDEHVVEIYSARTHYESQ